MSEDNENCSNCKNILVNQLKTQIKHEQLLYKAFENIFGVQISCSCCFLIRVDVKCVYSRLGMQPSNFVCMHPCRRYCIAACQVLNTHDVLRSPRSAACHVVRTDNTYSTIPRAVTWLTVYRAPQVRDPALISTHMTVE